MRSTKVQSFFPPLADVFFLIFFGLIAFGVGRDFLQDGDTGYHIRAGQVMLERGEVLKTDPFSFHTPAIDWFAHEWLAEILMALLYGWQGLTGVVIFFGLTVALLHYLQFRFLQQRYSVLVCAVFVFFSTSTSVIHWLARPHLLSILFTLVWYHWLDLYEYENKDKLKWFPVVMVLWVNLHGGYVVGLLLLAIYAIGSLIQYFFDRRRSAREERLNKAFYYWKIFFVCIAVSALNPQGIRIWAFPFHVVNNKFLMDHVIEFLSPNFHDFLFFQYYLFAVILILAVSKNRLNIIECLILLFSVKMALFSVRYVTLFSILVAPIVVKQVDLFLRQSSSKFSRIFIQFSDRIASVDRGGYRFWPLIGVMGVLLCVANGKIDIKLDENRVPFKALEFIRDHQIDGKMLNDDEFGDHLIFLDWPERKVFVDGRSDMYSNTPILKDYVQIYSGQSDWKSTFESYSFDYAFVRTGSPICLLLNEWNRWLLVYSDPVASIFVPRTGRNAQPSRQYEATALASPYEPKPITRWEYLKQMGRQIRNIFGRDSA